jgi:hypothetical protein
MENGCRNQQEISMTSPGKKGMEGSCVEALMGSDRVVMGKKEGSSRSKIPNVGIGRGVVEKFLQIK